jgi:hypothetical protein
VSAPASETFCLQGIETERLARHIGKKLAAAMTTDCGTDELHKNLIPTNHLWQTKNLAVETGMTTTDVDP